MATGMSTGCSTSFSAMVGDVSLGDIADPMFVSDNDRWRTLQEEGTVELSSKVSWSCNPGKRVKRFQHQVQRCPEICALKGSSSLERNRRVGTAWKHTGAGSTCRCAVVDQR